MMNIHRNAVFSVQISGPEYFSCDTCVITCDYHIVPMCDYQFAG